MQQVDTKLDKVLQFGSKGDDIAGNLSPSAFTADLSIPEGETWSKIVTKKKRKPRKTCWL